MMDRSRIGGALICVGTVVLAGLLLWGICLQSYWATAVPVIIISLAALALGFWIGWTIASTKPEAPKPEPAKEAAPTDPPQSP